MIGVIAVSALGLIHPEEWATKKVADLTDRKVKRIHPNCDVMEALRLLLAERSQHMLLVISASGELAGILTKTDILNALKFRNGGSHVLSQVGENAMEPVSVGIPPDR